jgi:1,2-diacylglycerol 3-alpha-glucosyltransferase
MRKLTIGLFLEHYEPFTSGVISSVKTLRQELQQRGHTVYIICPSVNGYLDSDPQIIRIPGFRMPQLENTTVGIVIPGTIRKLMHIKFDIIHGQEVYTAGMLGLYIARKQRIPYVQSYHTLWGKFADQAFIPWQVRPFSRLAAAFIHPFLFGPRQALSIFTFRGIEESGESTFAKQTWAHMVAMGHEASAVIIPSRHLANMLRDYGLTTPIDIIPNGVAPLDEHSTVFLPPKDPKKLRVISVARLSPEKRVGVLVEAVKDLKNVELIVVGDGPDRAELEHLAFEQDTARRIRFMGELSNNSTRELIKECDILALASYDFDNQPMVIIEALQAGRPILYCDPQLTEGLTPNNALLVDKEPQGFARGIKALSDKEIRESMSEASAKLSLDYSAKVFADRVLRVYEAAIEAS